MPAFTFEKISSPVRATASVPTHSASKPAASKKATVGKSRTLITQMLDRFAIARLKREQGELPPTLPRKPPPD
jgi:hypothetical protein